MSQTDKTEKVYRIEKVEENILRCRFVRDFYYSVDLAWEIYEECRTLNENRPYKILWNMSVRLQPQKELFDFYADARRPESITVEAFYLNSTALKLMANFYFRAKKPKIPSRVFDDEAKALQWLKQN